jgi:hypothetical protein
MNNLNVSAIFPPVPSPQAPLTNCATCFIPFNLLSRCPKCDEPFCVECLCPCDHVTAEHALASAVQSVWRTPLTPTDTLLVQDEHGVAYGVSGPGDCFLVRPAYEDEVEAGTHSRNRQAHGARYNTDVYAVCPLEPRLQSVSR